MLLLALSLAAAGAASAADELYWGNGSALRSGPLGGGSGSNLFADSNFPTGEAIDVKAGKIYWDLNDLGAIRVGNLDGTGTAQNLPFAGLSRPLGNMGIDTAAGKLYWADYSGNKISVGNLNGTGAQTLFSGESGPIGVAIDLTTGKIYWADWGSGTIRVGNLDGSGTPQTLFSGESDPYGVAIDTAAGRIYWANQGGTIRVGNLNGTGTAQTLFSGEAEPSGIALDAPAGKVYWGDQGSGTIRVGNASGTGAQTLFSGENDPVSPVLLEGPAPTGAPAISGPSTPGSTLTCSEGSWAPDLLGGFLYRVPGASPTAGRRTAQRFRGAPARLQLRLPGATRAP